MKFINLIVTSLLILIFNSCKTKLGKEVWNEAIISPSIAGNSIFKELDLKQEFNTNIFEDYDSLAKRTTNSILLSGKNVEYDSAISYHEPFKCTAYYFDSDTLKINIGISNGFTARGFLINYKNKKFYTEAYYDTDVVIVGIPDPIHEIIYQNLTLDKEKYTIGDSIFGQIEFKSIETNHEGLKIEHLGKGYFRSVVKE